MSLVFKKFNPKTDSSIKSFDCGEADLNDFILETDSSIQNATQHAEELLAVTYVLEDEEKDETIAYFSLLNDKIERESIDKGIWNKLSRLIPNAKRRRSYPAVKIGRLGVSLKYQHFGFGEKILDFVKQWFAISPNTGCRYLTVDALQSARGFYEKNQFKVLVEPVSKEDTVLMFYDLKQMTL